MNTQIQSEIDALLHELSQLDSTLEEQEKAKAEKKILYQVGKKYDEAQEWIQAETYLKQALAKMIDYAPEDNEEAEILSNLAGIQIDQERFVEAEDYYQKILALPENDFQGKAYHSLAFCAIKQQDPETALEYLEKAIEWNTAAEKYLDLGKNHHLSAILHLQQETKADALAHFEEALAIYAKHKHFEELKGVLDNLRLFVKDAMRSQNQLTFYNNHLAQSSEENDEALKGFWHYYRGLWYEEEQKSKEAFEDFEQAKKLHDKHQVTAILGMLWYHLGALLEEQGKHALSISYHAEALKLLLVQKEYQKVGLIAYFLKSSLEAVQEPILKQEIEQLLAEANSLGLAIEEDETTNAEQDPTQEPDWVSNEMLAENLAAVAQIHQLTREELQENLDALKEKLPEELASYTENALELAERYQQDYKGAWFNKKKKQQKFVDFCTDFIKELDNLAINYTLDEAQTKIIDAAKISLKII